MMIPTYYQEYIFSAKFSNNGRNTTMYLGSPDDNRWYDVYYRGELDKDGRVCADNDGCAYIVAKSAASGREILVFDGASHGYDNMFCVSRPRNDWTSRDLKKLNTTPVEVKIMAEYSIDYESEKEVYEFIDKNHVRLINGESMLWRDVKFNGITWLTVHCIDENGVESCILDEELA